MNLVIVAADEFWAVINGLMFVKVVLYRVVRFPAVRIDYTQNRLYPQDSHDLYLSLSFLVSYYSTLTISAKMMYGPNEV